jgi:hypothetical protein
MTTLVDILPHTLEYRNTLRQALKNQNITVQESKTRNFSGSMYNLSRDFKLDLSMSFRQYKVLRTIIALAPRRTVRKMGMSLRTKQR